MGRPPTTGNFKSRAELVCEIHKRNEEGATLAAIAAACGVSLPTAKRIIDSEQTPKVPTPTKKKSSESAPQEKKSHQINLMAIQSIRSRGFTACVFSPV
jgi:hypothetical protein